jgi:hypothetical protein
MPPAAAHRPSNNVVSAWLVIDNPAVAASRLTVRPPCSVPLDHDHQQRALDALSALLAALGTATITRHPTGRPLPGDGRWMSPTCEATVKARAGG